MERLSFGIIFSTGEKVLFCSALSLNGTEIWLQSYKQQFLRRMDIRKETDPEEEGAEPLEGPVGEAENCW